MSIPNTRERQVRPIHPGEMLREDFMADFGLAGGSIYDALHAVAAEKAECDRLYTYNIQHFRAVCPDSIVVSSP